MTPVASMSPLLLLHIVSALVAIVSGAIVFALPKGTGRHRQIGNVFFVSMLIMAALGAYLAELKHVSTSVMAGVFTCYLVATGWVAIRRENGRVGRFEIGALVVGLAITIYDIGSGILTLARPEGRDPTDAVPYLVFGMIAGIAAVSDAKVILHGISGIRRVVRHLWRMCAAMCIATLSLFLGQQKVFPVALHGSPVLAIPVVLVLGLTIWWIVRYRFGTAFRSRFAPSA